MKLTGFPQLPTLSVNQGDTTPTPSIGSGAMLWSSSTNAIMCWNGSSWQFASPQHPNFYNAAWYYAPPTTASTGSAALNYLYLTPYFLNRTVTLASLSAVVSSAAGTGGTLRVGIYGSTTGNMPGSLIQDYGTQAATSTGTLTWTATNTLTPGVYWLAAVSQTSACSTDTNTSCSFQLPFSAVQNTSASGYYLSGVSGSMPSSITLSSLTLPNTTIRIWLKYT